MSVGRTFALVQPPVPATRKPLPARRLKTSLPDIEPVAPDFPFDALGAVALGWHGRGHAGGRLGRSFSNVPVRAPIAGPAPVGDSPGEPAVASPILSAKLRIGRVDDPLEREADRAADDVVRGSPAAVRARAFLPPVQRACSAC